MTPRWPTGWRKWPIVGLAGLGVLALALVALVGYSALELARFERADVLRTTFVYAAGQSLEPGMHLQQIGLVPTLARLKYAETRGAPAAPGQFRRAPDAWEIFVRGTEGVGAGGRLRLDVRDDRIARITRDGREIARVELEPEVLTSAGERPGEDHRPVRFAEMPRILIDAVLAAEDHRFLEHKGIDLYALVRAAWRNLQSGRVVQGGSTITQQLVKVRLLSPKRTFGRKLTEAWLAMLVEWRYSKEQILEAYLNELYLGQRGAIAIRGVGTAARAYFGKEVHQLTLGEAALLAGMARAPNSYSPAADPDRARERRDTVLGRMRDLGTTQEADDRRARREAIRVAPLPAASQPAPYFVDLVRLELEQRFGSDVAGHRGVRIFTSLDLTLQRLAEAAVARGLDRLETRGSRPRRKDDARRLQAVLVALDPETAQIRALVGGRDYQLSQFNRATHARRQPGSAFKPFVYLAALKPRAERPPLTLASRVDDVPLTLTVDGRAWSPRNYEDRYEGPVSVRRALEQSLNAATVRVAESVGLPAVVETARALGLRGELAPVPAMVLGAFEVTPLDLARAYAPFANGGTRPPGPFGIRAVHDQDGDVTPPSDEEPAPVISPAEAYLMTSLLQGVIASGTGSAARTLGVSGPVAGKTGTTNEGRDAWFVGYAPRLLTLVWVGLDSGEPHGLSGSAAALPIWADFMRQVLGAYPQPDFSLPAGVAIAEIDATNGKRATPSCPVIVSETFLAGTEPAPCDEHRGVADQVLGVWRRFMDWFRR